MGWKWEALFGVDFNPNEGSLIQRSMIPAGRMGYRRRTIIAGPRMECEIYPVFGRDDEGRARAAKQNVTRTAQKELNRKRAERYITQLADANFGKEDIEVTLTYKPENMPGDTERCKKDVENFVRRVKRYREKNGLGELKYIYTIEGGFEKKNGFGVTNLHCHMLMNSGVSRGTLEEIWEFGTANSRQLQPDEDTGLEGIAKYMIKESKNHGRRFCHSRNLKKPVVRTKDAKTSNRAVKMIAMDIRNEAKAEMERMYPSYRFVECRVYCSDLLDGVYIRVVMRKRGEKNGRKRAGSDRGRADGRDPEIRKRGEGYRRDSGDQGNVYSRTDSRGEEYDQNNRQGGRVNV